MKKLTTEQFICQAKMTHGNRYDYHNTSYVNAVSKVTIACRIHGNFTQNPFNHIRGYGCRLCQLSDKRVSTYNTRVDTFISQSKAIHGEKYDYSAISLDDISESITISCKKHGEFSQHISNHLSRKAGCPVCGHENRGLSNAMTFDKFIELARETHGDRYDYHKVKFVNATTKIDIVCKKHGEFTQLPYSHYGGSNCRACSLETKTPRVSKSETNWLNSLGLPDGIKHRQVCIILGDSYVVVDGFDATTNTIYEFYGDFWHGNPEIFNAMDEHPVLKVFYGELYEDTLVRSKKLRDHGYRLIELWEADYKKNF
jgi:hypothetical protein